MAETTETPLLTVRDLRREYQTPGEPLVVLTNVNFELGRGASLSIMGPSGSGKSTLLNIIGTLDRPTMGSVILDGVHPFELNPTELATFRNRKIGFVFQDHHLLPQCTVLENILIPTLVSDGDGAALEARAKDLVERVGLAARADHRPAELSGGERQRVAVARALINSPAIVLCDEPSGNLDRKAAEAVGELFKQIQRDQNTSLVVVTHSPDFASMFDRSLELFDGALHESESLRGASS